MRESLWVQDLPKEPYEAQTRISDEEIRASEQVKSF